MKKFLLGFLCFVFFGLSLANAQTVETVLDTSDFITDYLVVGPDGNVYHADRANTIHKITPDGETSVYATSLTLRFITGMAFDSHGDLYVSSSGNSSIRKVSPDGTVSPFVQGLTDFPVGIDIDSEDNLYVSMWFGGQIAKYTPDGTMSTYAAGLDTGAVDASFDESGNLYSANFLNGNIFRTTPDGNTTMIASVNTIAGYLTYASGYVWVTGYESHYIYRVSPSGEVVEFSGTGEPGTVDGPVETAQFNVPNGISATASGDTIYISHDSGDRKLRRIIGVNSVTSLADGEADLQAPQHFQLFQNYPNPFNPETRIRYTISKSTMVSLEVFDTSGKKVADLVNGIKAPGVYETTFGGHQMASGIYFYCLKTNNFISTRRMSLVK